MELHCCEQITDWLLVRSVSVARPTGRIGSKVHVAYVTVRQIVK